jgi:hypothetical protein
MTAQTNMPQPWAVVPIGMDAAAVSLGISRRTLTDWLKEFDHFEWRGSKKVFYPEHIASLRREIHLCASRSNGPMDGLMHTARGQMVNASDALSKLKTLAAQKKSDRR